MYDIIAATSRKAGSFIAALASFTWSTAVLTVVLFSPDGSVYVVLVMPRSFAAAFIFSTNAFSEPASQRASSRATLFADAIRTALRASRWEIESPA